jgi:hypothetical protein
MAMIPSGLLKITGPNLLAPVISVNALVIKQLASYLDHAPVGNWLGGDVRSWVDYRKARRTDLCSRKLSRIIRKLFLDSG